MRYEKHAWHIINTDETIVNCYEGYVMTSFPDTTQPREKQQHACSFKE